MRDIHFISSLPRSGSTLLCNVLSQNSRFHSTQTSGCLDVLFGVRNTWNNLIEHQAHPNDDVKLRVLRGILSSYYEDVKKPVVFDKSRGWTAYLEMAEEILGKKVKVLVTIRGIPEILASMERLHRETSKTKQPPGEAENYFLFQSLAGRCEYWCRTENLVGLAYARVKDAIQRGYRDRLHFVKFDELTTNPARAMKEIYNFLEEEPFPHNFDNVEQVTKEDDSLHGYVGLHTIRSKVEPVPSKAKEILGEELYNKYKMFNLEVD